MMQPQTITLKPYRESDQDRLIELLTDASIRETYMLPDFTAPEDAKAMSRKLLAVSWSDEHYERGIYLDKSLIGFVNDVTISGRQIEIGYVIHPDHQNRGYATRAVAAAIDDLFRIGFSEISATAFSENMASRRVMEKCGMNPNGRTSLVSYRGKLRPCVTYAVSKPKSD